LSENLRKGNIFLGNLRKIGNLDVSHLLVRYLSSSQVPFIPDIQTFNIKILYFLSRPIRFTEESKTRFDGWIVGKTVNSDQIGQLRPAVKVDQFIQDHLQRLPVQGIIGLYFLHFQKSGYSK